MKDELLAHIWERAPRQKKKLQLFFGRCPQAESDLEAFLKRYAAFMKMRGISLTGLADAYLEMLDQVMQCRLEFLREGRYPVESVAEAVRKVYGDPQTMTQYMLGLALSQFLWEQHYKILGLFRETARALGRGSRCLEVGCGHGLYLLELLESLHGSEAVDVVDISQTSIDLSRDVLSSVDGALLARTRFTLADIVDVPALQRYDFISLGEVLEHVEDPLRILSHLRGRLDAGGRLFATTCANCPAIDHVYHFKSVEHIREVAAEAGFSIEKELVTPSEARSAGDLERFKIDISWAALLKPEAKR